MSAQIGSDRGADAVLRVFRADELRLFVAAASIALGFVILGFSLVRQRFDRLLSFLAWFAVVYGARLWLQSGIHHLMMPASVAANRLQMVLNFFVAIPAFLFFGETGTGGRVGRVLVNTVCISALLLMAAVLLGFSLLALDRANSLLIIAGSASLLFFAFRQSPATKDEFVFRAGLIVFVALVLWTNVSELLGHAATFEFYGFAILLCCLGYVAARRTLDRDERWSAIQQELDIARRIQMSILPAASPNSDNFCVATRYRAMTSVAGDFYEFLLAEDGGLGMLVADVSGHGVPAALIASMVKVAVQSQRHMQGDPASLLAGVNQALCGNAQNQLVTAAYVYLDARKAELRYAGAGHPPMLLLRDGEVISIEENGLVMALMPHAIYTSRVMGLQRGDRILLYTDGILEPINANEEEFGYERLVSLVKASAIYSPDEAADSILGAVSAWSASQQDDLTIMICDYKPALQSRTSAVPG
ncbi:PP2C family protein-serine/threonine phosphatase [Acidisarcina polymorpha]|uniref:PP2C family protein-serine/threonine phosphatase n=1 Tax=Acidisarcina polymorpha TaxID=2211140 RepID=UPI001F3BF450|nr:PP2C family protein-serine/threonine phosphatase [Acidisarcina polymorpha]